MADAHTSSPTRPSKLRRRLLWGGGAVALVAILALTPPLLNVSRLQRRISTSISASLGRSVRMESVQLHLLPTPGFTLNYLVVNEDPAFGNEPTIRADEVDAQLRVSSLWRRQVEFSRVRFVNPSVNLVRNADGRWNLEDILMHAANVDAAPTSQKTPGEHPRFPYIEATGARVNFKLGEEKLPFSLNEADFALWLPSPQQWQVRLVAKPLRTDENVGGTGIMRLEGALERASTLGEVPVNLKASWHDAPLGEASRLLTGEDANWRGTLHLDVNVTGHLNNATLKTQLTLDELRRADFVPAQMLDVTMNCATGINIPELLLTHSACTMPDGDTHPLVLTSEATDLRQLENAPLNIDDDQMQMGTLFNWLRLFSQRIPVASPAGTVSLHFDRPAKTRLWDGTATVTLPHASGDAAGEPAALLFHATRNTSSADDPACVNSLVLAPTSVRLDTDSSVLLSGQITACGYRLRANGTASRTVFDSATASLPILEDTLAPLVPEAGSPSAVDITCARPWGAAQSCALNKPAATAHKPATHKR
ncbi:MAG: AsmA family protein [Acidobacteriaceae bacterium]|nr:AsmA family protein [Acidobacteriaceae bacterium]